MKKEDLISKWLDNDLTHEELEAFKKLDAFSSYNRISNAAKYFEAPDFDPEESYETLVRPERRKKTTNYGRYSMRIAAVLVVVLGTAYFLFFQNQEVSYYAENADRINLSLPDDSEVVLNADSRLTYDKGDWKQSRDLSLDGEAYFVVSEGSKFTVRTDQGEVSVLGTQFNVKARPGFFEVICYEGLVQVDYNGTSVKLPKSHVFKLYNGTVVNDRTDFSEPSWISKKSFFKSAPLQQVLDELERQYPISIDYDPTNIDTQTIYTGSFSHENLETALQAITIPLNLTFQTDGEIVTLKKNE